MSMPHGRFRRIAEVSRLTLPTVYKVVKDGRGTEVSARAIADAVGCPNRWPELLLSTCEAPIGGHKKKAKLPKPGAVESSALPESA